MTTLITDENENKHHANCYCDRCMVKDRFAESTESENDLREAKRVAAITESMHICRTLHSNKIPFKMQAGFYSIHFEIQGHVLQLLQRQPETTANGYNTELGNWTAVDLRW